MTEHLFPTLEVPFKFRGDKYVAHCVPDEFDMGALEVCLFEVRDGGFRYVAYGVYGKRFVSYELTVEIRKVVDAAIRKGVRQ
jgi:hypothetical protein